MLLAIHGALLVVVPAKVLQISTTEVFQPSFHVLAEQGLLDMDRMHQQILWRLILLLLFFNTIDPRNPFTPLNPLNPFALILKTSRKRIP